MIDLSGFPESLNAWHCDGKNSCSYIILNSAWPNLEESWALPSDWQQAVKWGTHTHTHTHTHMYVHMYVHTYACDTMCCEWNRREKWLSRQQLWGRNRTAQGILWIHQFSVPSYWKVCMYIHTLSFPLQPCISHDLYSMVYKWPNYW